MNRPVVLAIILITASLLAILFLSRDTFDRLFTVTGGETINNPNNN